jgi:epoxide hydrolase-like predicted phosphatase
MSIAAYFLCFIPIVKKFFRRTRIIQAPSSLPIHSKKYSTIIFDMSGVLIDESHAFKLTMKIWPGNLMALRALKTLVANPLTDEFNRGAIDTATYAQEAFKKYGFDPESITQAAVELPEQLPLIPAGISMLETAKNQGYRVYLLTNVYPTVIDKLQAKHKFFSLFDGIMASCDVGQIKPEPGIYQTLLARFSIDPTNALFIDDRKINITAAAALGIDGIVCVNPKKTLQLLIDNNVLATS